RRWRCGRRGREPRRGRCPAAWRPLPPVRRAARGRRPPSWWTGCSWTSPFGLADREHRRRQRATPRSGRPRPSADGGGGGDRQAAVAAQPGHRPGWILGAVEEVVEGVLLAGAGG